MGALLNRSQPRPSCRMVCHVGTARGPTGPAPTKLMLVLKCFLSFFLSSLDFSFVHALPLDLDWNGMVQNRLGYGYGGHHGVGGYNAGFDSGFFAVRLRGLPFSATEHDVERFLVSQSTIWHLALLFALAWLTFFHRRLPLARAFPRWTC